MPQVFEIVFLMTVISLIKSVGVRRVRRGGVDDGGRWGAVGRLKQALKHKWQCCAISRWPRLAQLTGKARSAVRISLVPHAA